MKKSFLLPLLLATTALAAFFNPVAAHAAAGDIFVSDTGLIWKVAADGTKTPFFVSPALAASGVVFDRAGNLFAADTAGNAILKIAPDGTSSTFISVGLNAPAGLAIDGAGNLYVANSGTTGTNANSILKIAPDGSNTVFATGLSAPQGLAFDATGNLFVANSGNGTIVEILPNGTKSTFVSAGLNAPMGISFDALGNLLVADSGSNRILKVTANGTVTPLISTGLSSPHDVVVDASGNLLVADLGSTSVIKIAPNGTQTTVASGFTAPQYLALAQGLHQLANISTRGFVETGTHVLIGGFIIRGTPQGDLGNTMVVVRALGPELASFGVSDPLLDPTLELHNSTGAIIATNNNWKDTQQAAITATGLAPKDDRESAILAMLPDGNYTAIVRGAGGTIGVALVEVYNVPVYNSP